MARNGCGWHDGWLCIMIQVRCSGPVTSELLTSLPLLECTTYSPAHPTQPAPVEIAVWEWPFEKPTAANSCWGRPACTVQLWAPRRKHRQPDGGARCILPHSTTIAHLEVVVGAAGPDRQPAGCVALIRLVVQIQVHLLEAATPPCPDCELRMFCGLQHCGGRLSHCACTHTHLGLHGRLARQAPPV